MLALAAWMGSMAGSNAAPAPKRLLVVGSEAEILAGKYHSNIKPNAVLASVCAFEMRYDLRSCLYRAPKPGRA